MTTLLLMSVAAITAISICQFVREYRHRPDENGDIICEIHLD